MTPLPPAIERLRRSIATAFGTGRLPIAPGTFGSLWGLLFAWALFRAGGHLAVLAGLACVTGAGFWSSAEPERRFGSADPQRVVIDEVAGQMLSLLFLEPTAFHMLLGFALFRLFDIVKPYPGRRLESLPGSSGIMADDLLAGVYANLLQQAVYWGSRSLWGSA